MHTQSLLRSVQFCTKELYGFHTLGSAVCRSPMIFAFVESSSNLIKYGAIDYHSNLLIRSSRQCRNITTIIIQYEGENIDINMKNNFILNTIYKNVIYWFKLIYIERIAKIKLIHHLYKCNRSCHVYVNYS